MERVIWTSNDITLRVPDERDAELFVEFYRRNQAFLQPFSPTFEDQHFSEGAWRVKLRSASEQFRSCESMRCGIFKRGRGLIGVINFHSMSFKPIYDCLLGYALEEKEQGKGIIHDCLSASIPVVFDRYKMHRITAAYMPRNERSARVLRKLGFEVEGFCRDYLMIDGKWEDHIIVGLVNKDWTPE